MIRSLPCAFALLLLASACEPVPEDGDPYDSETTPEDTDAQADVSVYPSALDFGTLAPGGHAAEWVEITNLARDRDLHLEELRFGPGSEGFSLTQPSQLTLGPEGSTSFLLRFEPDEEGEYTGVVEIESDAVASPLVELALLGSAGAVPEISLDHLSFDFGEVTIGTEVQQTVTISNTGEAELVIDAVEFSTSSAEISCSGAPSDLSLEPGEDYLIIITYAPLDEGLDSASLELRSNDPQTPILGIVISGAGVVEEPPAHQSAARPQVVDIRGNGRSNGQNRGGWSPR
jgi:hypothetical protein